jgi:RHS repeat-associated protein
MARIRLDANRKIATATIERPSGKVVFFVLTNDVWVGDSDLVSSLDWTTDSNRNPVGWTLRTEENTVETYDAAGTLQSITDLQGNTQTLSYNAQGRLEGIDTNIGEYLVLGYDAANRIASVTDHAGRSWGYSYDVSGNLQYVDHPDGTTTQYHYEDANFPHALTGITDERGVRYATFNYDAEGRAILSTHAGNVQRVDIVFNADNTRTVTNSLGQPSSYSTGVQLGVALVTDVSGPGCSSCGGNNTGYGYDPANNNLLSKTENGVTTEYGGYDKKGQYGYKIEAVGTPEERRSDYTYDARFYDKITSIAEPSVNPAGIKVTSYTYDDYGNRTSETVSGFAPDGQGGFTPVSRTTSRQYNGPLHQLSFVDGPRSDVSDFATYRYYPNDNSQPVGTRARLKEIEDANGVLIRADIRYSATGKVISEQRSNGLMLTYTYYAGNGRLHTLIETTGTASRTTRWTYLATGEVEAITTADGTADATTLTFGYDDARRLTRITDGLGNYIAYTLDTEGNRTFEKTYDGGGALRKQLGQTFDLYSRLDASAQANESLDYNFAPDGTLDVQTDGRGSVTDYSYDSLKRLTQAVQNLGGTDPATADTATAYGYDVADRLTSVTDPVNGATAYAYDDLGNLLTQTSPDTGTTDYQYDAAGNLVHKTDAKGQSFTYSYDALNRLTLIDAPGSSDDIAYGYDTCSDGVGRLCSVTYGGGALPAGNQLHYRYNGFGEATAHQGLRYAYDAAGRLQTVHYPSGSRMAYHYDAAGQVSQVDITVNGVTQALAGAIAYAPFGPITGLTYGNGLVLSQNLDTAYRLTAQTVPGVVERSYPGYDANGNRLGQTDALASPSSFTYDPLNRLDIANGPFGTRDYDYDKNGNRTQLVADSATTALTYEPNSNRLDTLGASGVLLDATGNTLNNGAWSYSYTPHHRLSTASESATLKASFAYNGLGQRIARTDETTASGNYFLYGPNGELLVETDQDGNILLEYLYLNGQLLAAYSPDDDQDGIPNQQEAKQGSLPVNPDSDGDGLTNLAEWFQHGTDSTNPDSDGDGVLDGAEIAAGTSPVDAGAFPGDGDINENGQINLGDLVLLYQMVMGTRTPTPAQFTHADMNRDGRLNAADILLLQKQLLQAWLGIKGTTAVAGADLDLKYKQASRPTDMAAMTADWLQSLVPAAQAVQANQGVLYYVHNDPLGTPQVLTDEAGMVVWRARYDPFGKAVVDEDPDGDGNSVTFNVRFPGQYYDQETGLHYNYFRYYDPQTGRFVQPDPIGLSGGLNTFAYALGNAIRFIDPYGLDVNVCLYPNAANRFGHVGFGFPGEKETQGFYPRGGGLVGRGEIKPDKDEGESHCETVKADPKQDVCMMRCRAKRKANPGRYNIFTRQCTSFVRDCLTECGLPSGSRNEPHPATWFWDLTK